jgi:hypothetical protein
MRTKLSIHANNRYGQEVQTNIISEKFPSMTFSDTTKRSTQVVSMYDNAKIEYHARDNMTPWENSFQKQ